MQRIALLLATSLAVFGCADLDFTDGNSTGPGGKADSGEEFRSYEVLLTQPPCDICSADDKAALRETSPIISRVVELIGQAQESIDVAQFTFSVTEIRDALVAAHERGVHVRLAIDEGQDQEGTVSRELRDLGLDVRFVVGKPLSTEGESALQHAKFMIVDGTTLLTGSNNWSSTGTTINDENSIVVHSTAPEDDLLITGFQCHFEAIWADDYESAAACSNELVGFSPSGDGFRLLREQIRLANKSIDVIMHHLVFDKLTKELANAAERGVQVRVLLNAAQRDEYHGGNWGRLLRNGGRVRYKQNNDDLYQIMHNKLVIIDDQVVVNGSGNWSGSAFFNNYENYVFYSAPTVVGPLRRLFARLWTWSLSTEALDAGVEPAADGFGAVHGACGIFTDDVLDGTEPHFYFNRLDFGSDPFDDNDRAFLSDGGQTILDNDNAGGSSLLSEVFAFEMLHRCEDASLVKTETEIAYSEPDSKITDLLVSVEHRDLGVSVTRAVTFPREAPLPIEEATALLEKKLGDILDSSAHVAYPDGWEKQVLHVLAYSPEHAATMESAYYQLPPELKADTIVVVTVSDGDDEFLY